MEGRTGSLSSISVLSVPQGGQDWPVVAPTWSQLGNRDLSNFDHQFPSALASPL